MLSLTLSPAPFPRCPCRSENDEVDIVAKIDEQWWEGVLNGAQGVFPSTYVEEI